MDTLRQQIMMHGWGWQFSGIGFGLGVLFGVVALVVAAWTLYWKFKALWYAAKHDDKLWFIVLLLVNTLGILEILYLHVFSKHNKS